jgi:hypothetical protein
MKIMIAALALLTFALCACVRPESQSDSYYGLSSDYPAFTVQRPIGNVWAHWMTRPEP